MQTGTTDFIGVFQPVPGADSYIGRCATKRHAREWAAATGVTLETTTTTGRGGTLEMAFVLPVLDVDVAFQFEVVALDAGGRQSSPAPSDIFTVPANTPGRADIDNTAQPTGRLA